MRLLISTALALAACSRSEPAHPPPASGEAVYAMACRRCHGPTGAGDGPLAGRIGPVPDLRRGLDHQTIRAVVLAGRGAMPAHRGRLSVAQIEAVVDLVSRWRHP